jgi:hypothetical protein
VLSGGRSRGSASSPPARAIRCRQALDDLGIDERIAADFGTLLACTWPVEPQCRTSPSG